MMVSELVFCLAKGLIDLAFISKGKERKSKKEVAVQNSLCGGIKINAVCLKQLSYTMMICGCA